MQDLDVHAIRELTSMAQMYWTNSIDSLIAALDSMTVQRDVLLSTVHDLRSELEDLRGFWEGTERAPWCERILAVTA